jgi:hypothetical protein
MLHLMASLGAAASSHHLISALMLRASYGKASWWQQAEQAVTEIIVEAWQDLDHLASCLPFCFPW